jgi:D,D-heptose 1,7-bisphosphate phosphatase
MKNKALFLDRDGIINVDKSYVFKIEDIEWMPGILELIKFGNTNNFKVIVLTNQSGIDRGYYTEKDVLKLHDEMTVKLESFGAIIDDWFYCKDLDSNDRKPNPGMMLKAISKHNIDIERSYMIGDKESDVLNIIGPEYLLLKGKYELKNLNEKIHVFKDLLEIKNWIVQNEKKLIS